MIKEEAAEIERPIMSDLDFDEVLRNTQNLVYSIILSYTGNHSISEDLAQETYLKAYSKIKTLRNRSALKSWLCTIARNLAINWIKARKTSTVENNLDSLTSKIFPPFAEFEDKEAREAVEKIIDGLSPVDKEILIMRYRGGLSYKAIANVLNMNPTAVGDRLYRIIIRIKEKIAQFFGDRT